MDYYINTLLPRFFGKKNALLNAKFAGRTYALRVFSSLGRLAHPLLFSIGWTPQSNKIHLHRRRGCPHPDNPNYRASAHRVVPPWFLRLVVSRSPAGRPKMRVVRMFARANLMTAVRRTVHCGLGAFVHSQTLGRLRTPRYSVGTSYLHLLMQTRSQLISLGRYQKLRRRSRSLLPGRTNLWIGSAAERGYKRKHWTC